jgi:hypothetical protein
MRLLPSAVRVSICGEVRRFPYRESHPIIAVINVNNEAPHLSGEGLRGRRDGARLGEGDGRGLRRLFLQIEQRRVFDQRHVPRCYEI